MHHKKLKIQPIITTGYRPIRDGNRYEKYFPSVNVSEKLIVGDRSAEVDDVVRLMHKVVWKFKDDTKDIAQKLKGASLEQTITNIWEFLYHHIQYKLDTPNLEELRRPARLWHDKHGDCDDFSIAASSILTNLNIPNAFRITKYDKPHYQHVYVIVPHAKGYYIIDPVLSQANYEKPFTEKKDFNMNLNGINVAVLEGFGNTEDEIIENMLLNDLDLQGLGSISDEAADQRMYNYLVSTRSFAEKNREGIAHYDNPDNFIRSLDYAIKYWNTPKREEALRILEQNEERENQMNAQKGLLSGIDDEWDDGWDDIAGFGSLGRSRTARRARRKKFWGKVKKGLKKVGKTLNRFNPGVAAIRGGIIIALRINMFGFKERLKWAYASTSQLQRAGVKSSYSQKAKKVLAKIEKIFEGMGGKKSNLKKAILKGKKGQLTGTDFSDGQLQTDDLDGLGAISSAAMLTAATTVLGFIKKIFTKNKLGKKEKVTTVPQSVTQNPATTKKMYMSASNSGESDNYSIPQDSIVQSNSAEIYSSANPTNIPTNKPPNKIVKILKDNPLYAAIGGFGILGLSFWGVSSFMKKKKAKSKAASPSISGHGSKKKKSPKRKTPKLKIEKLQ